MGEEKLQIENFKNIFEFKKKIEILMIRNFWMKKNAKKFNKCETRQKCHKNHKTLCNKVKNLFNFEILFIFIGSCL